MTARAGAAHARATHHLHGDDWATQHRLDHTDPGRAQWAHSHNPEDIADYVWPDPHGDGWVDAWNGWYETEAEARRDGAGGIGRPWVLAYGEGIITEDAVEDRMSR